MFLLPRRASVVEQGDSASGNAAPLDVTPLDYTGNRTKLWVAGHVGMTPPQGGTVTEILDNAQGDAATLNGSLSLQADVANAAPGLDLTVSSNLSLSFDQDKYDDLVNQGTGTVIIGFAFLSRQLSRGFIVEKGSLNNTGGYRVEIEADGRCLFISEDAAGNALVARSPDPLTAVDQLTLAYIIWDRSGLPDSNLTIWSWNQDDETPLFNSAPMSIEQSGIAPGPDTASVMFIGNTGIPSADIPFPGFLLAYYVVDDAASDPGFRTIDQQYLVRFISDGSGQGGGNGGGSDTGGGTPGGGADVSAVGYGVDQWGYGASEVGYR